MNQSKTLILTLSFLSFGPFSHSSSDYNIPFHKGKPHEVNLPKGSFHLNSCEKEGDSCKFNVPAGVHGGVVHPGKCKMCTVELAKGHSFHCHEGSIGQPVCLRVMNN